MNKVIHFEIPTDNTERAEEFYKKVFGWDIQPMPEMNYTIVRTVAVDKDLMPKEKGAINGGLYKRSNKMARTPVLVIGVPSIDAHIKKVEKAGGKVFLDKMPVGKMGLYAQISDTEGNIIGIWENVKK